MIDYKCSKCGLAGHKLWRQYQTFVNEIELLCATCAEEDQTRSLGKSVRVGTSVLCDLTDQVGWLVPAVPVVGEDTFWGYTTTPNGGCIWWYQLPTFKDDDRRELAWLDAWIKQWERSASYYAELLGDTFSPEEPAEGETIEQRRHRLGRLQSELQDLIDRRLEQGDRRRSSAKDSVP